jgi:uncharacterized protein YkwD
MTILRTPDLESRIFLFVVAFGALAQAGAADYDAINEYRISAQVCDSIVRPPVPELKARTELEEAARDASAGENLAAAVRRKSYRATRVTFLGVSAVNTASLVATLQRDFCRELGDPEFSEMGIHRDKGRVWLVLAVAVRLPEASEWQALGRAALALINQARGQARRCGTEDFGPAPPLAWNDRLAAAALAHSGDMAAKNYFSHEAPDGSHFGDRIGRAGYVFRAAGENIAAGQATPEKAVAAWLESPPHCVNVMRREFTESGIAFVLGSPGSEAIYWTQTLGAPR